MENTINISSLSPRLCKIINDWNEFHQDGEIVLISKNNLDDTLVAVYSNNTIYLLSETYFNFVTAPRIIFSKNGNVLNIEDVLMKSNNIGNGTVAMNALFLYAKINNIKYITGHLSSVDDDHKMRRDHFYKKFGFTINSDSIYKELINE